MSPSQREHGILSLDRYKKNICKQKLAEEAPELVAARQRHTLWLQLREKMHEYFCRQALRGDNRRATREHSLDEVPGRGGSAFG